MSFREPGQTMPTRRDVINKTILRKMRKFFRKETNKLLPKKSKGSPGRAGNSGQLDNSNTLQTLSTRILQWADDVLGINHSLEDQRQVVSYLQMLMDPGNRPQLTEITGTNSAPIRFQLINSDVNFLRIFDNYTHKSMVSLILNRWVDILFLYFYHKIGKVLLARDSTLKKNPHSYTEAMKQLMTLFNENLEHN